MDRFGPDRYSHESPAIANAKSLSPRQVRWVAEEVARQRPDNPSIAVANMADALALAERNASLTDPTAELIAIMGALVEPQWALSNQWWRTVGVYVNPSAPFPPPSMVGTLMGQFVAQWRSLSALDAFCVFESIHPFRDGNGRVGAILYNWHLQHSGEGGLAEPIHTPDWDDPSLWWSGQRPRAVRHFLHYEGYVPTTADIDSFIIERGDDW